MSLLRDDPASKAAASSCPDEVPTSGASSTPVLQRTIYRQIPPRRTWFDGLLTDLRSRGAGLVILTLDVVALASSIIWLGNGRPISAVFSVLVILLVILFAQATLYRSRLTLSVLDDLPLIVGRFFMATGPTA